MFTGVCLSTGGGSGPGGMPTLGMCACSGGKGGVCSGGVPALGGLVGGFLVEEVFKEVHCVFLQIALNIYKTKL